MKKIIGGVLVLASLLTTGAVAQDQVVNVYSSRHYDTDDAIYDRFTEETGIKVNLIEGGSDALLARLQQEGDLSPADVFITVDAGRLYKAVEQGVFAPVRSDVLEDRIPESLRHPDGLWFGLTQRVRVLVISKDRVQPGEITTYEALADPAWRGRVLIRSSSNIYNQSLIASMIEAHGEEATEAWCRGVVENMARKPQGGDTDQIRAVAAGEGDVAVVNHYYLARMMTTGSDADREAATKVRLVFPNQDDRGAHVNVSGAGVVATAPNRENAIRFLEFLAADEAQHVFNSGNNEYPVTSGVSIAPVLKDFGPFESDPINAVILGENNRDAVRIMDRAGWR